MNSCFGQLLDGAYPHRSFWPHHIFWNKLLLQLSFRLRFPNHTREIG